jgi:hypothetical protein
METRGHGFQEVLLGFGNAQIHHVAGRYAGHENDQIILAHEAFALGYHGGDFYFAERLRWDVFY